ncbi:MAG: glycosyltransferase [Candidatus Hodarchaeota archaeon]
MASDDPEAIDVYEQIKKLAVDEIKNQDLFLTTVENDILVNALQRKSDVIIQKSIREGFGLTVTEALWKGTPVVASNVGGIPLQIKDSKNGFLCDPMDLKAFSDKIITILQDSKKAKEIGRQGTETVRKKFLITRLLMDHLDLYNELINQSDIIEMLQMLKFDIGQK